MRPTGYIQDLPDPRDRMLESVPPGVLFGSTDNLPDTFTGLADGYDLILRQEAESCTGFAAAEALLASWLYRGIPDPELASPLFIWWNARKMHGAEKLNSGTYLRFVLRQMRKVGFCPNTVWKGTEWEDAWNFSRKPSRLAFKHAIDQKLTDLEFYRIGGVGDERMLSWKRALSSGNPVVFGVPVERDFFDWNGSGYIDGPSHSKPAIVGGHAMCALAYTPEGVYGPQSYGRTWGRQGWFYLSWDYILNWGMDQWAFKAPQYFSETP